ncbi:hypothetical protein [Chitinimonas lacunae]|uniref:YtxH domain-containing protein n=1 Tax=Chitinimonas lacunae TaxID=1963018 RepID=A0ABV8MUK1_9NEIS
MNKRRLVAATGTGVLALAGALILPFEVAEQLQTLGDELIGNMKRMVAELNQQAVRTATRRIDKAEKDAAERAEQAAAEVQAAYRAVEEAEENEAANLVEIERLKGSAHETEKIVR